jgi:chemotaxis protein MotB
MAARKHKHEEHENHERWLVSYADFITLLFAFFVVMYATSNNNVEKQKKFEDSVRKNLHLAIVGQGADGAQGSRVETLIPELAHPIEGFPRQGGAEEVQDYVGRKLNKSLEGSEKESITQVHHDLIGARIALAASTFFPVGSSKLKLSSLKILDKVADILKQTDRKVIIEGHTDDVPVTGDKFDSNWELASLRATSVVRYLIKYHQIDPARLAAISYADQKPLVPNNSDANRAKNRRIEILIVTNDKLNE